MGEIERLMQEGESLIKALEQKGEQIEKGLKTLTDALFELTVVKRANWPEALTLWNRGLDITREYEEDTVKEFHKQCGWRDSKNGNLEEVKRMLEEEGEGLLSQEYKDDVWPQMPPLTTASIGGLDSIVEFLLAAGADVGAKEEETGRTALHQASGNGRASTVKILLKAGAEVDAKDRWGETPLKHAILDGRRDWQETARFLTSSGASIEAAYEDSKEFKEHLEKIKADLMEILMNQKKWNEAKFLSSKTGMEIEIPSEDQR
jgi:hypothetical protein